MTFKDLSLKMRKYNLTLIFILTAKDFMNCPPHGNFYEPITTKIDDIF